MNNEIKNCKESGDELLFDAGYNTQKSRNIFLLLFFLYAFVPILIVIFIKTGSIVALIILVLDICMGILFHFLFYSLKRKGHKIIIKFKKKPGKNDRARYFVLFMNEIVESGYIDTNKIIIKEVYYKRSLRIIPEIQCNIILIPDKFPVELKEREKEGLVLSRYDVLAHALSDVERILKKLGLSGNINIIKQDRQ